MDRDRLIKRLMATFISELSENVAAIERDVLALEQTTDSATVTSLVRSLFRTAHSLKGAARAVDLSPIEAVCHFLEDHLATVRDTNSRPGRELLDLLLAAADALGEAGDQLRKGQGLSGSGLERLLPRLAELSTEGKPEAPARETKPDAPARVPTQPEAPAPLAGAAGFVSLAGASGSDRPPPRPAALDTSTVRVNANKLDTLLTHSGELLVARRRFQSHIQDLESLREQLAALRQQMRRERAGSEQVLSGIERSLAQLTGRLVSDDRHLAEIAAEIDADVRRVRMLPFSSACEGLDRLVRDLAAAQGKEIDLSISGGDVELDRSTLESLKDPLRHLIRNAIDHGAETPQERKARGKPRRASLHVSASLHGDKVVIAVRDDGRGIDLDNLRQVLQKRGLAVPEDERELVQMIFLPGLSTSKKVTDVSGRGVGLDVVKERVEGLHGGAEVTFTPGAGTTFSLSVPLTLTTLRALIVRAGDQPFAIVGMSVDRMLRIQLADLRPMEGRTFLPQPAGPPLLVASLADTLGMARTEEPGEQRPYLLGVAVSSGDQRMVFLVEELLAEQEIVIKTLGSRLRRIPNIAAAAVLSSGQIAFVLNSAELLRTGLRPAPTVTQRETPETEAPRRRILVADDSLTTRVLEKTILEAAGYEVAVAADGLAAWQLLQEQGADLLVSDVEMPRMDGITLTEKVRATERYRSLPVILVTGREKEEDRARGAAAGADAYLVKSAFDQRKLLETIAGLL